MYIHISVSTFTFACSEFNTFHHIPQMYILYHYHYHYHWYYLFEQNVRMACPKLDSDVH